MIPSKHNLKMLTCNKSPNGNVKKIDTISHAFGACFEPGGFLLVNDHINIDLISNSKDKKELFNLLFHLVLDN